MQHGAWIVVAVLASGCRDKPTGDGPAAAPVVARVAQDAVLEDLAALREQIEAQDRDGQLGPAVANAERLVAELRARKLTGDRRFALALELLGRLLFHAGRWKEAEPTIDEALAMPIAKTDRELRSMLLFDQGSIYSGQRRNDEAIAVMQESLALTEELHGKDSFDAANTGEVLAAVYDYAGRYAEAEVLFRRSIAVHEKDSDARPVDLGRALANLALNLEYQERDDDALVIYRRALPLLEQAKGSDATGLAEAQAGLARILHRKPGKLKESEAAFRQALATRRAALGDEHPSVAMDYHNLAIVLEDQRKLDDALAACESSEEMRRKLLAPDHPHRLNTEGTCERLRKIVRLRRRR
ncbi:MAG: tetratricopeptide repeat protein [Deltaproteobacteria bacterium]|nr:tetratricopeptide repeat protein [Deltaproteobacteria bacterium]MDQ3298435.1 tetratricopeptide repeat protein [Myxococcota bacterium]